IGSGRIDSILSANKVARRYELDGELASLALGVIPVAGLLAESARTLREDEYAAFKELAALPREDREKLLISADRFVRPSQATTLTEAARRALLARFGIFGVRLATALLRRSTPTSTDFAEMLVQQSGLNELQQFVREQFRTRAATLKIRGVLDGLERVLADFPRDDVDDVRGGIERIRATAHSLRELSVLARARADGLPLAPSDADEAERIIGGKGTAPTVRLGVGDDATDDDMRAEVDRLLDRWRALGQSPLTERSAFEVCRVVTRSLEEIASVLPAVSGTPHVVLAGGPGEGAA
ncbi:MAG TPA: GTP-binding protein, partial [Microbacterium sp.]|nr:GTP-binding protein [Microbacterium sp.]